MRSDLIAGLYVFITCAMLRAAMVVSAQGEPAEALAMVPCTAVIYYTYTIGYLCMFTH